MIIQLDTQIIYRFERFCWKFHRIWSTDWFFNKEQELELEAMNIEEAILSRSFVDPHEKDQLVFIGKED